MRTKKWTGLFTACLAVFAFMVCSNKTRMADEQFRRGCVFEKSGRLDSALVQYRRAIAIDPRHMRANMAYQDLAANKPGTMDEVWDTYEMSAKKHRLDPVYQILFIRLQDNNDDKIEQALRVVKRDPGFFWGHVVLASAYEGYGDRDYTREAVDAYENAAKLNPAEIEIRVKLANLYRRLDNAAAMNQAARKALQMDSTRSDLLPILWQSEYMLAANKDSAKSAIMDKIEKSLAARGHDLGFLNSLQRILQNMDMDREQAGKLAEQVAVLDPKGTIAQELAISRLWDENNPRKGIRRAEAFLDSFPDSPYSRSAFGMWLTFSRTRPGFHDEQVDRFAKGLLDKNSGRTWLYESLFRYYSGKDPNQIGKLEQIVRSWLDASSSRKKTPILKTLAVLYMNQNRTDDALRLLLQADSLCQKYRNSSSDGYASVYASIGDAYQKKGNIDLAFENYLRALSLGDDDAVLEKCTAAYEKKFGSREGFQKFINQRILTEAAVKNPFPAPDFTLATVTDDTIRMAELRGKVVLVAIWNPG